MEHRPSQTLSRLPFQQTSHEYGTSVERVCGAQQIKTAESRGHEYEQSHQKRHHAHTFRSNAILFSATSRARVCLLFKMRSYWREFTYTGSSNKAASERGSSNQPLIRGAYKSASTTAIGQNNARHATENLRLSSTSPSLQR